MIRTLLVLVLMAPASYSQDNTLPPSPCPSTFSYEGRRAQLDRWYGVILVTTDTPLNGLRLDVTLNGQAMTLGNWIGKVTTQDRKQFTILNLDKQIVPGPPISVRIFVEFPENDEIPGVKMIALNGRQICPEQQDNTAMNTHTSDVESRFQVSSTRRPHLNNEHVTTASNIYDSNPRRPSIPDDTRYEFQAPSTTKRSTSTRNPDRDQYQPSSASTRPERRSSSTEYDRGEQQTSISPPYTNHNTHNGDVNSGGPHIHKTYVQETLSIQYSDGNSRSPHTQTSHLQETHAVRVTPLDSGYGNQPSNNPDSNLSNKQRRPQLEEERGAPSAKPFLGPISTRDRQVPPAEASGACGKLHVVATPLITHGQTTSRGQWPWHAALYQAKDIDLTYICGGSLVSRTVVITAAHCVAKLIGDRGVDPDNLVVYLGKYHLKLWSEGGVQNKQVVEVHIHPAYNSSDYRSDVAILVLSSPAEFTEYVRPVCLWGSHNISLQDIENREGYVAGWGFDEHGHVTEELMMARMPVVAQEMCLWSYPEFFSRYTNSKTYCAGFRNGTSVCNGDSGGGMVFPELQADGSKVWHLRGLVSLSVSRDDKPVCDTKHYVIFADLAKYQDWVNKYIQ